MYGSDKVLDLSDVPGFPVRQSFSEITPPCTLDDREPKNRDAKDRDEGEIVYLSFFLGRSWFECPHFLFLQFVAVWRIRYQVSDTDAAVVYWRGLEHTTGWETSVALAANLLVAVELAVDR